MCNISTLNDANGNISKGSFFDIFNISCRFDVDLDELEQSYLALQQKVHPDKNAQNLNLSSHINHAYKVLNNPLERAKYMLKLQGVGESYVTNDRDILTRAMNWQEQCYEARTKEGKVHIKQVLKEERARCLQNISLSFSSNDYQSAKKHVLELNYIEKSISILKQ